MKKHKVLKIILIVVGSFLATIITFVGAFLIFASATTLQVKDVEDMKIDGDSTTKVDKSSPINLLTWNIGYGALDERQDCYWDGGKGVDGESKEVVLENVKAIKDKIEEINPDIFFVQEADRDSKRSYYINQYDSLGETFDNYESSFACNFKAGLVPLPLYNMTGKVDAGITSFSKYDLLDSKRIQLPVPFSWPMSLFNLKRCLLVNHLPIEGSDKQLVLINLHLEAYDDGEGKAKQLAVLMDMMKEEYDKGNYVIAGGDFNQTFSTTDHEKYPTESGNWVSPIIDASLYPSFQFLMDDTHPTCRYLNKPYYDSNKEDHQYYMIDGYIVSKNITINNIETLDLGFKNTDHNPVKLSVTLA